MPGYSLLVDNISNSVPFPKILWPVNYGSRVQVSTNPFFPATGPINVLINSNDSRKEAVPFPFTGPTVTQHSTRKLTNDFLVILYF